MNHKIGYGMGLKYNLVMVLRSELPFIIVRISITRGTSLAELEITTVHWSLSVQFSELSTQNLSLIESIDDR